VDSSILTSVKKVLNIVEDDTSFDPDIILFINGALSTLNQLGVGPGVGFAIEDKTPTWVAFLGSDPRFNDVKTYVCLRVRLLFDPPQSGYATKAIQEQIEELAWRLNVRREETQWVDPNLAGVIAAQPVIDGGVVG